MSAKFVIWLDNKYKNCKVWMQACYVAVNACNKLLTAHLLRLTTIRHTKSNGF